jgi:hypothetical protein
MKDANVRVLIAEPYSNAALVARSHERRNVGPVENGGARLLPLARD